MTRYSAPRLLTPPREEEAVYPYRRVWPSLLLELGGLSAVTFGLYIMVGFLGINAPESLWRQVNIGLALLPAVLWLLFSRLRENSVEQPRRQLTSVLLVSALAANAVGIPLIDTLAPQRWLSLATALDRIIGYAVTIGVIQELVKYLVLRFIVWPDGFRVRSDVMAYSLTAAVGYTTILNLHAAFDGTPSPDVLAIRIFSNTTVHIVGSMIVAYGLTELRFNPKVYLNMPVSLLVAALFTGLAISFRAGLTNGGFVLGIGGARPLFGLVFSLIYLAGSLVAIGLLMNNARRRAEEASQAED